MKENITLIKGLPRSAEICLALGGLIFMLPLLLLVVIAIKAVGGSGAVLFSQRRVGLNGEGFTLYKFRTMRIAKSGPLITAATDCRITKLGRMLRKTKLDELPELWNVLKGDMSFVGPRPEVPELVDLSNPLWIEILRGRPGITDPVTLKLRNEEFLLAKVADQEVYYREILQPYKLKGYAKYLQRRTWKSDIKIICQTAKAIVLPTTAPPPSQEEIRWSFAE